jgi:hypothetical protein
LGQGICCFQTGIKQQKAPHCQQLTQSTHCFCGAILRCRYNSMHARIRLLQRCAHLSELRSYAWLC